LPKSPDAQAARRAAPETLRLRLYRRIHIGLGGPAAADTVSALKVTINRQLVLPEGALGTNETVNDAAAAVETLLRGKYGERLASVVLEATGRVTAEPGRRVLPIAPEVTNETKPAG
jgi:hypothetical protein